MKKSRGPFVYEEDMTVKVAELEYECAYLRHHISELNLALIERKQLILRSQIVACRYRDMLDGIYEKFAHLTK